jgi:hypothetical protein
MRERKGSTNTAKVKKRINLSISNIKIQICSVMIDVRLFQLGICKMLHFRKNKQGYLHVSLGTYRTKQLSIQ